jgi:hypothetical protein
MVEAVRPSETLANFYQTALCCNPGDSHLCTHSHENLKSYLKDSLPVNQYWIMAKKWEENLCFSMRIFLWAGSNINFP